MWKDFEDRFRFLQQPLMCAVALGSGGVFFVLAAAAVTEGWWWILFPAVLLMSPASMAGLRVYYEQPFKLTRDFVNPRVMSWAFVLGDFVLLPLSLTLAAVGWGQAHSDLVGSETFLFACLGFGYGLAIGFPQGGTKRYRNAWFPTTRLSPSKVWHDWAFRPGVIALFVWVLVPQLSGEGTVALIASLFPLAVFMAAVSYDSTNPPNPRKQYPEWDPLNFQARRRVMVR